MWRKCSFPPRRVPSAKGKAGTYRWQRVGFTGNALPQSATTGLPSTSLLLSQALLILFLLFSQCSCTSGGNPCRDYNIGDGTYGRPCSRYYFVCSHGQTFDFSCAFGEVHGESMANGAGCVPEIEVAACAQNSSLAVH